MALADLKVSAKSFTGSQTGIITNASHRRAKILRILGDRIRETLKQNHVAIVAGFQGVSENKEITTLGRGGSDTTAVALAAALGAESCEIYTDVNGVFTADPRIVPQARHHQTISFDSMRELAWRGAAVLHPRCVEIAARENVKLFVKNTFAPQLHTTEITKVPNTMETAQLKKVDGITYDRSKCLMTLQLARPGVFQALLDFASQEGLLLLSPTLHQQGTQSEFMAYLEKEFISDWTQELTRLCQEGFIQSYQISQNIHPLSVVGYGFTQDLSFFSKVQSTLQSLDISSTWMSSTPTAIHCAIPDHHLDELVVKLHSILIEAVPSNSEGPSSR
jgi:aspartate kinase